MSLQGCLIALPVLQGNNRPLIKHFARAVDPFGVRGHMGHRLKMEVVIWAALLRANTLAWFFLICGRNSWNEDQMAEADVDEKVLRMFLRFVMALGHLTWRNLRFRWWNASVLVLWSCCMHKSFSRPSCSSSGACIPAAKYSFYQPIKKTVILWWTFSKWSHIHYETDRRPCFRRSPAVLN